MILPTGRALALTMTIAIIEMVVWTVGNLKDQLIGELHLKKFVLV